MKRDGRIRKCCHEEELEKQESVGHEGNSVLIAKIVTLYQIINCLVSIFFKSFQAFKDLA